jgi:hypothetical protein
MSKNSRATSWLVYCAELEAQKRPIISDCFWPDPAEMLMVRDGGFPPGFGLSFCASKLLKTTRSESVESLEADIQRLT